METKAQTSPKYAGDRADLLQVLEPNLLTEANGNNLSEPSVIITSEAENDFANAEEINDIDENDAGFGIFASDCNFALPEDVDRIIAQDLARLSLVEREKVNFDLHGITYEVEETPAFVHEHLRLFEMKLPVTSDADNEAYHLAMSLGPAYVQNERFRLRFLRADRFDSFLAVKRFLFHFKVKLELFGPELLVRDIVQDDLDEEDLWVLYNKMLYTFPVRDMAGRLPIFLSSTATSHLEKNVSPRSLQRRTFYCFMVITEDEETQRKGVVGISYNAGEPWRFSNLISRRVATSAWAKIRGSLPWRPDAVHLCSDSIFWRPMYALFRLASSTYARVRIREHYGTHQEIIFQLQTYGIPTQYFPNMEDGTSKEEFQKMSVERWTKRRALERRWAAEKLEKLDKSNAQGAPPKSSGLPEEQFCEYVGTPRQDDVLLGRGRSFFNHTGNVRLRYLIMERPHLYENAGYSEKKKINTGVVDMIKAKSGRFLESDGAGWKIADDEAAINKVGHLFRNFRQKSRKAEQKSKN